MNRRKFLTKALAGIGAAVAVAKTDFAETTEIASYDVKPKGLEYMVSDTGTYFDMSRNEYPTLKGYSLEATTPLHPSQLDALKAISGK